MRAHGAERTGILQALSSWFIFLENSLISLEISNSFLSCELLITGTKSPPSTAIAIPIFILFQTYKSSLI